MSWLDDALGTINSDGSTTTVDDSSPLSVGGSVNGDPISDTLASITSSINGDSLRTAADRLLGNNNVVDQIYGVASGTANAGRTPATPATAPKTSMASTLVHYAPILIAVVVALALFAHGRLFR